jgi:hypothetical protein
MTVARFRLQHASFRGIHRAQALGWGDRRDKSVRMRVLMLAISSKWLGPPRLARALSDAGCEVASLSPGGSLLEKSSRLVQRYRFASEVPADRISALERANDDFLPDRLLAADELAAKLLHAAHADPAVSSRLRDLIVSSMGDPAFYECTSDKFSTSELAAQLGIAVPTTAALTSADVAHDFVHRNGWPVVIKACRGFAGIEVYPCASLRDLRRALRECPGGEQRLIQRFEEGSTWMTSFVAERGVLLAALCAEKRAQHPPVTGPSTVVRFEHDAAMVAAASTLVAALGFSGFGSIDFQKTCDGRTLLLEFNPRPTPISHLGARLGVDLAAAYCDGRTRDSSALMEQNVALFPQEMLRDPSGGGIGNCWHDVPEDEPELLEALQGRIANAIAVLRAPA